MESLVWTQEPGLVPADLARATRRGCGRVSGLVLGSVAAAVLVLGLELSWWWGGAAWLAAVALGSLAGRGVSRLIVHRVEVTPTAVRLVRSDSTRVLHRAELVQLEVSHTAGPAEHRRTSLRLTYGRSGSVVSVNVVNRYDPTLASALVSLLGPGVPVLETRPAGE